MLHNTQVKNTPRNSRHYNYRKMAYRISLRRQNQPTRHDDVMIQSTHVMNWEAFPHSYKATRVTKNWLKNCTIFPFLLESASNVFILPHYKFYFKYWLVIWKSFSIQSISVKQTAVSTE
jgi:hypothetical protein